MAIAERTDAAPGAQSAGRIDRRVVFVAPGAVELQEHPVRDPGPGEILLETRKTLISTGTELAWLSGPPWVQPESARGTWTSRPGQRSWTKG